MFSLFRGGRVGFVLFFFLMHEVTDECEKDDDAVY